MKKDFWNNRYKDKKYVYGVQPNEFFKKFIDTHEAGKLLLPAEGEGRNAVYAAARGWDVDAFDFSKEARSKAIDLADEHRVSINYFNSNLQDVDLHERTYDLIGLIYVHLPQDYRRDVHQTLIDHLANDGYLILEAFSKEQIQYDSGGPKNIDMLYSKDELEKDFRELHIDTFDQKDVELNEGPYHKGKANVIQLIGHKI